MAALWCEYALLSGYSQLEPWGESGKVNPLGLPVSSTEAELKYTFPTKPISVLEI